MPKYKEFMKGFTIFHVIGIVLLVYGAYLPGYESRFGFSEHFNITLHVNVMSITGFISFFIELVKHRLGKNDV